VIALLTKEKRWQTAISRELGAAEKGGREPSGRIAMLKAWMVGKALPSQRLQSLGIVR
jgi:hypothetical protein